MRFIEDEFKIAWKKQSYTKRINKILIGTKGKYRFANESQLLIGFQLRTNAD